MKTLEQLIITHEEGVKEIILVLSDMDSDTFFTNDSKLLSKISEDMEFHKKHSNHSKSYEVDVIYYRQFKDDSDYEDIKRIMFIDQEVPFIKSVYNRSQKYGGSEEGGWYYHTMQLREDLKPDDVTSDLDSYGEGLLVEKEFFLGQHEKMNREFYC